MRDRRPERAVGCAHRVDVDPLRVVRRAGEGVDPLLRHLDPRRRAELLADEVAQLGHAATDEAARIRASDSSLPSSSRLSYSPGETREPVTATRIGR